MYHRPMNRYASDVTAFILAGGKSSRMGTDKAFVTLGSSHPADQTLLARALEVARSITPEVRIVGDPAKFAAFAPTIADIFPNCGPLGGIHAALRSSLTDLNLILAVDVPFVSPTLLQYLIDRARKSPSSTVTAAQAGGGWQPLCAVYRRDFAGMAGKALEEGHHKIAALFATASTLRITEKDLESAGFSPNMFRNLNTPLDLAQASGIPETHEPRDREL
jgi:molybdopterin-guanine dinucleotide biosynthesis protein A